MFPEILPLPSIFLLSLYGVNRPLVCSTRNQAELRQGDAPRPRPADQRREQWLYQKLRSMQGKPDGLVLRVPEPDGRNEWGYSARVEELIGRLAAFDGMTSDFRK